MNSHNISGWLFLGLLSLAALSYSSIIQPAKVVEKEKHVPLVKNNQVQAVLRKPLNSEDDKKAQQVKNVANLQSKGLSNVKQRMEGRVKAAQMRVNSSKNLSPREKDFKLYVLEMFLEELRESEKDMLDAEEALKKSLTINFWDANTLKENSKKRLEALRVATLKEEKSYNRMHAFEMNMKKFSSETNSTSWMGEIIKEISHAADQLEMKVADHELSERKMKNIDGSQIEAVVHVKEKFADSLSDTSEKADEDDDEDISEERHDVLIDSQDNKYIRTRLNDPTSPFIDHRLIMDIIMVMLLSIPLGYFCQAVGLPSLFGYVLSGLILGPSCFNWIQEMIQLETLGELGVYLIMFSAGLEFSVDRIQKVWKTAIQAPCCILLLMIVFGVTIGLLIDAPASECAFVSVCLSFSSTPLVSRFLQASIKDSGSSESSSILLGMLIVQDIQLSFVIAMLPGLALHHTGQTRGAVIFHASVVAFKTLLSLSLITLVTLFVTRFIIFHYVRHVSQQTRELQLLGAMALMYIFQIFTNLLGVSMELGCFIAGALIAFSSHLPGLEDKVRAIHDFMSVLFFASIGFHVFPSFVFVQLSLLVTLTAIVIAGKYLLCSLVLRFVLPPPSQKLSGIVSSGLAQVSEFSFVLGSRARHFKIITREVYLLILSVTTLSLLLAPALWKLSIWRYRVQNLPNYVSKKGIF